VFGFESEADLDKAADRIRGAIVARVPVATRGPRPRTPSRGRRRRIVP